MVCKYYGMVYKYGYGISIMVWYRYYGMVYKCGYGISIMAWYKYYGMVYKCGYGINIMVYSLIRIFSLPINLAKSPEFKLCKAPLGKAVSKG